MGGVRGGGLLMRGDLLMRGVLLLRGRHASKNEAQAELPFRMKGDCHKNQLKMQNTSPGLGGVLCRGVILSSGASNRHSHRLYDNSWPARIALPSKQAEFVLEPLLRFVPPFLSHDHTQNENNGCNRM